MTQAGFAHKVGIATGLVLVCLSVSGVAAAPSVPASMAATRGVAYVGTTSQGRDVSLVLSRSRREVRRMTIDWVARSTRCSSREPESGSVDVSGRFTRPIPLERGGLFGVVSGSLHTYPAGVPQLPQGGTLYEVEKVAGRIGPRGGRGRFREFVAYTNFAGAVVKKCDTGHLRWKVVQ